MSAASWIGPAIVAAVISALVTAAGWIISERQSVRREAARRRERLIDLQTAILAEVRASRHHIGNIEELSASLDSRLAERSSHVPFVTRPAPSFVLNAVLADIHVLPISVIDPVVLFYRQSAAIALFVDDLRSEAFVKLDVDQKQAMYRDYVQLLSYADVLAERAIATLSRSLNISAEDRSDHRLDEEPAEALERTPLQSLQDEPKAAQPEDSRDRTS